MSLKWVQQALLFNKTVKLMMNDKALLPCPFCDGEAILHKCDVSKYRYFEYAKLHFTDGYGYSIACYNCQIFQEGLSPLKNAIEEWNTRPHEKKYDKLLAFVKSYRDETQCNCLTRECVHCKSKELLKEIGE